MSGFMDLIRNGAFKPKSVLNAFDSPAPPASIAAPAPSQSAPYYGGTVPSPAAYQAQPSQYGYAPRIGGQGVYANQPLSAPSVTRNTPSYGIGTPTSGGYGGTPAPAPQSKPVISESDWLAGDGEYQNQLSQFDSSLQDFLGRLATQKTDFTNDYNTAMAGFGRNKEQGMQNLGEDFTSRGLANSGLFADSRNKTETMFKNQENAMTTARDRANSDFQNQENDKRKATEQAKGNAKLSSLGRMSMKQMF